MVFGQKRERFIPGDNGQSSLFDAEINITPESEIIRYARTKKTTKKQNPHFRNPISSHIPRKAIVIEPEGIDTSGLKRIGEEVTEELWHSYPFVRIRGSQILRQQIHSS